MVDSVPKMLRAAAEIYQGRSNLYGDNYKRFGSIMVKCLDETTLTTADDYNRFGVLVQMISKLTRYCHNFRSGGHSDSLDDLAVYSMMLKELDEMAKSQNAVSKPKTEDEKYAEFLR